MLVCSLLCIFAVNYLPDKDHLFVSVPHLSPMRKESFLRIATVSEWYQNTNNTNKRDCLVSTQAQGFQAVVNSSAFFVWKSLHAWGVLTAYFKFIICSPPVSSGACQGDPNPCRTFVPGVFSPATPSSVSMHRIHFSSLPTKPLASAESEQNFQLKICVGVYMPWAG